MAPLTLTQEAVPGGCPSARPVLPAYLGVGRITLYSVLAGVTETRWGQPPVSFPLFKTDYRTAAHRCKNVQIKIKNVKNVKTWQKLKNVCKRNKNCYLLFLV